VEADTPGTRFARAFATKDYAAIENLVAPDLDFRALTPNRDWKASDPTALIEEVLKPWLEPGEEVEEIELLETDRVADRERVGYRFRVRDSDGLHVFEQQAYVGTRDDRIDWMRVVCSGWRPIDESIDSR
jgi:hypothetical protein